MDLGDRFGTVYRETRSNIVIRDRDNRYALRVASRREFSGPGTLYRIRGTLFTLALQQEMQGLPVAPPPAIPAVWSATKHPLSRFYPIRVVLSLSISFSLFLTLFLRARWNAS